MARRWPKDLAWTRVVLEFENSKCGVCGRRMHVRGHRHHRIYSFDGALHLVCKLVQCPHPRCPNHKWTFGLEREMALTMPRWLIGCCGTSKPGTSLHPTSEAGHCIITGSITHIQDGFDFLGQNVRHYRNGKVLLKPSKRNIHTFLTRIRNLRRGAGRRMSAGRLIEEPNRKIEGWAMYHRHASSKRTFACVDHQIFTALWRWCRRRHRRKNTRAGSGRNT